jgi:chromate transporter
VAAVVAAGATLALFRWRVGVLTLLGVCALLGLAITLAR